MKLQCKAWKKDEKNLYLPNEIPSIIDVPAMQFFMLKGTGNPNSEEFAKYIEALYGASYAVRMSYKGKRPIEGYYEYTVYPLEGVWDLTAEGKALYNNKNPEQEQGVKDLKDHFSFKLMIRQPEFVTQGWMDLYLAGIAHEKKNDLITQIKLVQQKAEKCVQILHVGPYDTEPISFDKMEQFCHENGFTRLSKTHREIYISDNRKTAPEKLMTTLRIEVDGDGNRTAR